MISQIHQPYPNISEHISNGVRQNLVEPIAQQQLDLTIQQILSVERQPALLVLQQQNLNSYQQRIIMVPANQQQQRTFIPSTHVSSYKYWIEICTFFGCLIQILYFNHTYIHYLWIIWYVTLGYRRHFYINTKIRFYGELGNLIIWVLANFYVFNRNLQLLQQTMFPLLLLLLNMDYYFVGYRLFLIYFCFFTRIIYNSITDICLRAIQKKLQKRKQILIQNLLQKFIQTQLLTIHKETDKLNDESSQDANIGQFLKQKQLNCAICLDQLIQISQQNQEKKALKLQCGHRYHFSCIKDWIQLNNNKCPICRRNIY